MWVTSLGLAGEAGIFASLPFYPMFSGVPNGPLRLSPPQVHAAVHNSGEIAYGCICMVEHAQHGSAEPSQHTHSWRMRRERNKKQSAWLTVRMNSEGWDELGDRLEILWGPDYKGRHDLLLFKGKGAKTYFSEIPKDFSYRQSTSGTN